MRLSGSRLHTALRLVNAPWEANEVVTSHWSDRSCGVLFGNSVDFCARLPFKEGASVSSRTNLAFLLLNQPLHVSIA